MWVKLDDGFADHPKIIRLSDAAFREHLTQLLYAARHLTDGHVPRAAVRRPAVVGELVEAGLWEPTDGGWRIHDWSDYNPCRAEVLDGRKRRRAAPATPRARDVIVDALAEIEGADPTKLTRLHARRLGVAAAEIRRASPGVDAAEVRRRAARYRARWPRWALTAMALASRWASLEQGDGDDNGARPPAYLRPLEAG